MVVGIELRVRICRWQEPFTQAASEFLLIIFRVAWLGSLCSVWREDFYSKNNSFTILIFIGNGGILLTLVVCKASRNSKTFELRKIKCILDNSRCETIYLHCF